MLDNNLAALDVFFDMRALLYIIGSILKTQ